MMLAGRPRATTRFAALAVTHAAVPPTAMAAARRGRRATTATADRTGTAPKVPYCIAAQMGGNAWLGNVLAERNRSISVADRARRARTADPARIPKPIARPARSRPRDPGVTVPMACSGPSLGVFGRDVTRRPRLGHRRDRRRPAFAARSRSGP